MNVHLPGFLGAVSPLEETVKETDKDGVVRSAVTEGSAEGGVDRGKGMLSTGKRRGYFLDLL